jgi:hypothetical protein
MNGPRIRGERSSGPGILAGVDEFVDERLGLLDIGQSPHYMHKRAHRRVAEACFIPGEALVSGVYDRIEANWPGTPSRSRENWRLVAQPAIGSHNASPEKRFEKTLVRERPEWVNMIPVASGVLPDIAEGGRRIDLARECAPGWFELIELKVGPDCDTPLRGAIEILGYGMLYLFSRVHGAVLGYGSDNALLSARKVSLKVLAPSEAYGPGSLQRLEAALNAGIHRLVSRLAIEDLEMDFSFEHFREGATWPPGEVMDQRQRTYPPEEVSRSGFSGDPVR